MITIIIILFTALLVLIIAFIGFNYCVKRAFRILNNDLVTIDVSLSEAAKIAMGKRKDQLAMMCLASEMHGRILYKDGHAILTIKKINYGGKGVIDAGRH